MSIVGKTLLTLFFIMVITGSIIASVLTVYIVNFLGNDTEFDLRNLEFDYTTTLYAEDAETGEAVPLQVLRGDENRIWVDIDHIPYEMRLAAMAAEDRRFMKHQGVDWKLTTAAFINLLAPFRGGTVGGSTITQQVIKNISGEKEVRVDRKIKEIFRALALEKEYSKDDVMEAYLNTIALGNNTAGVQAAANLYFGKDVDELDTAECAAIIAITQNPSKRELFRHEEGNLERRTYILDNMLEMELATLESQYKGESSNEFGPVEDRELTKAQYQEEKKALEAKYAAAKEQELVIQPNQAQQTRWDTYSYFVDYVIEEVRDDLVAQYGYTPTKALDMINNGGLSIYTTVDRSIQDVLDEKFITNEVNYDPQTSIFPHVIGRYIVNGGASLGASVGDEQPQCAMVIMDYEGNIKGIAGGRGEKTNDRAYNIATDGLRQTGSCIKPISVYGPAIEFDLVTWSTLIEDSPFRYRVNGKLVSTEEALASIQGSAQSSSREEEEGEDGEEEAKAPKKQALTGGWPINFQGHYTYAGMTVDYAIRQSINTVAVKTLDRLTPQTSYDFLANNLNISSLNESMDKDYAPLALGAQSEGISLLEMTAAYQIFGNGGLYYEPHSYTRVVDKQGNVLLEANTTPRRVISEETAAVMNKLLQGVTTAGTGTPARLNNLPTIGKTGTSSNDKDQWFMGGSPYYVAGVWYGYDKLNAGIDYSSTAYPPPVIWKRVMSEVSANQAYKEFPTSDGVVQMAYCLESGDLATGACPRTGAGWYKESALPGECAIHSGAIVSEEID